MSSKLTITGMIIGCSLLLAAILLPGILQPSSTIDTTYEDATVYLSIDPQIILASEQCVHVEWDVQHTESVYVNDEGQAGVSSKNLCGVTDVELLVNLTNGDSETFILTTIDFQPLLTILIIILAGFMFAFSRNSENIARISDEINHNRFYYISLATIIVALPLAITFLLIHFYLNGSLLDFMPDYTGTFNDEMLYWRQALTFSQTGFEGGYYTDTEIAARASMSHFFAWGPMYPLVYGTIGRVLGWYAYTAPIINIALVTIALAFFIRMTKPDFVQLIFIGLIVLTFWSLLLLIPSNMQSSLFHACAIVFAGIFYLLLSRPDKKLPQRQKIAFLAFIIFSSTIRVTWSIMSIPFFLLLLDKKDGKNIVIACLKGLGLSALVSFFFVMFSASVVNDPMPTFIAKLSISISDGLAFLWSHIQTGLSRITDGEPLLLSIRYQLIFLFVIFALRLLDWRKIFRTAREYPLLKQTNRSEILFMLFNLGSPFVLLLVLHHFSDHHSFRFLAPPLLISLLLLALFRHYRLLSLILLTNALLLPSFFGTYYNDGIERLRDADRQSIAHFGEIVQDALVYDAETSNAWCNTLLIKLKRRGGKSSVIQRELMSVDPGIGISFYKQADAPQFPLKSQYLLLDAEDKQELDENIDVAFLTSTSIGDLYRNKDADCG